MSRNRNWMKISAQKLEYPLAAGIVCQSVSLSDAEVLGALMDNAYRDTIDHEGETFEQCVDEMKNTIQGKYGPFISQASFMVTHNNKPVSAILMTEWKSQPLVAFTMTDKSYLGKGLAKFLLGKAVSALHGSAWKEIFLVVTEGNTSAESLYEKVGFKNAGPALPGTPPPVSE